MKTARIPSRIAKIVGKIRFGVILERNCNRVLCLTLTSFQGRGTPPRGQEGQYLRLAHRDDLEKPVKDENGRVSAVRFSGSRAVCTESHLQLAKPEYLDVLITPMTREGMLEKEDLIHLADAMQLPDHHQLRQLGMKLVQQYESTIHQREQGTQGRAAAAAQQQPKPDEEDLSGVLSRMED